MTWESVRMLAKRSELPICVRNGSRWNTSTYASALHSDGKIAGGMAVISEWVMNELRS